MCIRDRLQAPYHITVFFQKRPGIVVQRVISAVWFILLFHSHFLLGSISTMGESVSSKVQTGFPSPQRTARPVSYTHLVYAGAQIVQLHLGAVADIDTVNPDRSVQEKK